MSNLLRLVKANYLLIVLILYLVYYTLSLYFTYPILEDEAWYANAAYSFIHGDWFRTKMIGGGLPNFIFPFFEGLIFKFFGVTYINARITSICFGFASILILNLIFKLLKFKDHVIFLALIFFIISPLSFSTFHRARPECAAVFFTLLTIYYFLKSRLEEGRNTKSVILCSLFSGIAFLTHPFTFPIYFVLGVYFLVNSVIKREFINLLIFISIAFVLLTFFFLNYCFFLDGDLRLLIGRTGAQNSLFFNSKAFIANFMNVRMLSYNGIFLILIAVVPGFILWGNVRLRVISLVVIFIILICSFTFNSNHKANYLLLNYINIFSIMSIAQIMNIYDCKVVFISLVFYIVLYSILNITKNTNTYHSSCRELNVQLSECIPQGSRVLGDMRLWFLVPSTNFTAIALNRYNKTTMELMNETDYILICNQHVNYRIKQYNEVLKAFKKLDLKVDTIFTKSTMQFGEVKIFKIKYQTDN
jgi:hypothetical protein